MGIKIEELQIVDAKYFQARLFELMQLELFPGTDVTPEWKRIDKHLTRLSNKLIKHQHPPYFSLGMARAMGLEELEIDLTDYILENFDSEKNKPELLAFKKQTLSRMKENGQKLMQMAEKLQEKNGYRWL